MFSKGTLKEKKNWCVLYFYILPKENCSHFSSSSSPNTLKCLNKNKCQGFPIRSPHSRPAVYLLNWDIKREISNDFQEMWQLNIFKQSLHCVSACPREMQFWGQKGIFCPFSFVSWRNSFFPALLHLALILYSLHASSLLWTLVAFWRHTQDQLSPFHSYSTQFFK